MSLRCLLLHVTYTFTNEILPFYPYWVYKEGRKEPTMLKPPVHNISLVHAVVWAINYNYAKITSSPLTIAQFAMTESSRQYQGDLIDAVLLLASKQLHIKFELLDDGDDNKHISTATAAATATTNTNNLNNMEEEATLLTRETAIWFLDSVDAFSLLEAHLLSPKNRYSRNGDFCIAYTGEERARLGGVRMIFQRLFAIYAINVNIFVVLRDKVQLYNNFPFTDERCGATFPTHHGTFDDDTNTVQPKMEFFPSKMKNMYACEFSVVTFDYRPYVFIEDDPRAPNGRRLHGIEGQLFLELAEKMNFTVRLIEEEDMNRGTIYENGTSTGAINMVIDGKANFTFVCYMYSQDRAAFMLPSLSYTSFPIALCIPGGLPMPGWQRLIRPFKHFVWTFLGMSVVAGFCVICGLRQRAHERLQRFVLGDVNTVPCLSLWTVLCSGPALHVPHRNFARALLAIWLLYTLVLRNAYSAQLYTLLQDGRIRNPFSTIDDIFEQDYMFYVQGPLERVFRSILPPKTRIYGIQNGSHTLQILRTLRDDPDADLVLPLLQPTIGYFNEQSGPEANRITVLPEPMLIAPLTMYMRQHSYLKSRIDELLIRFMSAGIVDRLRHKYFQDVAMRASHATMEQFTPKKLNFYRMGACFAILDIMLLLAIITFVLEWLSGRQSYHRLRRFLNAVNNIFT